MSKTQFLSRLRERLTHPASADEIIRILRIPASSGQRPSVTFAPFWMKVPWSSCAVTSTHSRGPGRSAAPRSRGRCCSTPSADSSATAPGRRTSFPSIAAPSTTSSSRARTPQAPSPGRWCWWRSPATAWPVMPLAASSPKCLARSTIQASTPRSSCASTPFRTRTPPEAIAEADTHRRTGARGGHRRAAPTSAIASSSRSTASTPAISTTPFRSSGCRTATTGWACTSRMSRTT